jgi:hypothetical protein
MLRIDDSLHKKTLHYGHGDDILLLTVEGEIKSYEEV